MLGDAAGLIMPIPPTNWWKAGRLDRIGNPNSEVDFVDLMGGHETFAGEVIVSEARALAILEAFADNLDWPPDTRWLSSL